VVSFIDKAQTTKLIKQYPKLGLEIDRRFAQEGERLLQRMADLAYENVEERLAHVLLSLGERHGVREGSALRIDIPFSQQDLANMVGASRQRVNWKLRKLADQGLIQMERCQITILDDERLQNLK
jgi:CRP/FNR family transcriptional regulator